MRVLFVSHMATRSGAPLLLLPRLKRDTAIEASVALRGDGPWRAAPCWGLPR
jgi:hypothetical protein